MKVLIVDDSSIVRNRIMRLMSHPAMPPIKVAGLARDGAEALGIFAQCKPEIVTIDLAMPVLGGADCIEAMVKLDPEVKILIVSALSDKASAITALKKGARGFLHKPFTDEQLIEAFLELVC
jgi:two-component system chemotaxis response regulator CheY